MSQKEIFCFIKEYKGFLAINYTTDKSNDIVSSPYDKEGRFGYVVSDIGHVGISNEAYELMKSLRKGRDSIGEIDVFLLDNGGHALATMGGMYTIIDPKNTETSRQYHLPSIDCFQLVDNDVEEGAKEVIDEME